VKGGEGFEEMRLGGSFKSGGQRLQRLRGELMIEEYNDL